MSNKTKGTKQDSQSWLKSTMSEGGEPQFKLTFTLFKNCKFQ